MRTVNLSAVTDADRALCEKIAKRAGVNLSDCYQCGKCSAGCPMAEDMDLPPQRIMRMLQLGLVNEALNAKGPWLCAQCMVCSTRCPQNIEITDIMREVRLESHAQGRKALPESDTFESLFIKKVRNNGRSNEQYLAAGYNMSSGHLMQDMGSAPKMFTKGLVGIKRNRVKDRAAVERIIDACEQSAKEARNS